MPKVKQRWNNIALGCSDTPAIGGNLTGNEIDGETAKGVIQVGTLILLLTANIGELIHIITLNASFIGALVYFFITRGNTDDRKKK